MPPATILYAELLANIRQVSVIAALAAPSTSQTRAHLSHDGQLLTVSHAGHDTLLRLPAAVRGTCKLQPITTGLKEISWRLPLADQTPVSVTMDSADSGVAPWSASKLSATCQASCKQCRAVVVDRGAIRVWKDLPSENWAEMMDFWHCHKPSVLHKHDDQIIDAATVKGYGANQMVESRAGTGFVDLTYFLLHPDDCPGVTVQNDSSIVCASCQTHLGIQDRVHSGFRLFKWSLVVSSSPEVQPKHYPLSHFLTAYLEQQIAAQGVHRFLLRSKHASAPSAKVRTDDEDDHHNRVPILHIWVFAPHLTISLAHGPPLPSTASSSPSPSPSPSPSSRPPAIPTTSPPPPHPHPQPPIPVSKIFYTVLPTTTTTAATAAADALLAPANGTSSLPDANAPEEILFDSPDVVRELEARLRQSTAGLPVAARAFRGWTVGWLERFVEGEGEGNGEGVEVMD